MKAQEVVDYLNHQGTWVDFDKTRDIFLLGDPNQEITKIGVSWVATLPAIEEAIKLGVNFIISHENYFYEESTSPRKAILDARKEKMDLLMKHQICVFRCHDVWDRMPVFGVADRWSKAIDLPFEARPAASFYSYAHFEPTTVEEIAHKVADGLQPYGQDSVTLLGDPQQIVRSVAIGTGAITDIFTMLKADAECLVTSDDGINNWIASQYCVDYHIPMIIVHHSISELPGIHGLFDFLSQNLIGQEIHYLEEGYRYRSIR